MKRWWVNTGPDLNRSPSSMCLGPDENIDILEPIIFHKEAPHSSPLDVACLCSNLDIIQYLVETLNVDIAKFFNKELDRDIVLSTLLDVRYNTDKILNYLFERYDYDFNKSYHVACPVNKNSKTLGYMYLEIMNITEYVEYHRSNKKLTGEKKEVYDAQCDNVQRVIEKHKLEALIKVNDKSSEKNNKIKL